MHEVIAAINISPSLISKSAFSTLAIVGSFFLHTSSKTLIKFLDASGTKNQYLFDIKTSVITSMNVNHDPNSIVSFHNDGSPVQSQLTLTFKEIEYVVSDESPSVAVTQAADAIVEQANAAVQREQERQRIENVLEARENGASIGF